MNNAIGSAISASTTVTVAATPIVRSAIFRYTGWRSRVWKLSKLNCLTSAPVKLSVDQNAAVEPEFFNKVGHYSTWSLSTTYSGMAGTELTAGIKNLFDKDPPFTAHNVDFAAGAGWDPRVADPRLRVAEAPPLPPGWSGKQHACAALGALARHELIVFVDADVRLAPDALSRMAGFMQANPGVGLASGFPAQVTLTWSERLLLPLIHFLLIGFLPIAAYALAGVAILVDHPCGLFAAAAGALLAIVAAILISWIVLVEVLR